MVSLTGDMSHAQMGHERSHGTDDAVSHAPDVETDDHGSCGATMTCASVFSVARGQSPPIEVSVRQARVTTAQWPLHGSILSGLTPPPRA